MNELIVRNPDFWTIVTVTLVVGRLIWAWLEALVLGLLIPDKYSVPFAEKIAHGIAKIEYQPYWWIPVGLPALILGIIVLLSAIKVNWVGLLVSLGLLALAAIWIASIFVARRKRTPT